MANTIVTPNMGLPNPVPGVDPGPDYANNISSCYTILDQHNHTSGQGVLIPSGGLNINSDLPYQGNNATGLRSVRFNSQSAVLALASDINCLYVVSGNLYFNDGLSDSPIQITAGGAVNATASGISDGSGNTAAFNTGVLVVQNSSTAPDNIQCGSILLGNQGTPSSNYLTLSPANSLAASYTITFPVGVPVSSGAMLTSDTSGNLTYTNVDNSTLAITTGVIAIKSAGITGTQVSNNINLPGTTVQEGGQNVVVSNTNAATSLSIVRATFNSSATLLVGEGATAVSVGPGAFDVTFTTPFSSTPVVVTSVYENAGDIAVVVAVTTSTATILTTQAGSLTSLGFSFIAIGPR